MKGTLPVGNRYDACKARSTNSPLRRRSWLCRGSRPRPAFPADRGRPVLVRLVRWRGQSSPLDRRPSAVLTVPCHHPAKPRWSPPGPVPRPAGGSRLRGSGGDRPGSSGTVVCLPWPSGTRSWARHARCRRPRRPGGSWEGWGRPCRRVIWVVSASIYLDPGTTSETEPGTPWWPATPILAGHQGALHAHDLRSESAGDHPEPLGQLGVEMLADDRHVRPGGQMHQGGLSVVVLVTAQHPRPAPR
jgi:hypothetical protein